MPVIDPVFPSPRPIRSVAAAAVPVPADQVPAAAESSFSVLSNNKASAGWQGLFFILTRAVRFPALRSHMPQQGQLCKKKNFLPEIAEKILTDCKRFLSSPVMRESYARNTKYRREKERRYYAIR